MRRLLTSLLAALLVTGVIAAAANAGSDGSGGRVILEFRTMAPVTGPFVGSGAPIRGVVGGGLPWQIAGARGELLSSGHLEVSVEGLVLLDGDPVPPQLRGTNPVPTFQAIVSCRTIRNNGKARTTNVATDPFPATSTGDAETETTVSLPSPCVAPIVFVGPSPTVWFSATGN